MLKKFMNLFFSLKQQVAKIKMSLYSFYFVILFLLIDLIINSLKENNKTLFYTNFLCIIFLIILSLSFLNQIKTIRLIVKNAKKISEGHFSVSDIIINEKNDFRLIAQSLNEMKTNLLFYIENTKKNVVMLSETSEILSIGIEQTIFGNNEISNTINTIADETKEQVSLANETVNKVKNITESIENINENINLAINLSNNNYKKSIDGEISIENLSENMIKITNNTAETYAFLHQMRENVASINKITDFIVEISNRLTLLSFNAAIESARTGEGGKGFSVVANEMKKLANLSKDEVEKINSIIINLINNSETIEDKIKENMETISIGNVIFNDTKNIFSEISNNNKSTLNSMEKMLLEAKKISIVTNETENISSEVKTATTQISSSTSEISKVVENANTQINSLNQMSKNLNQFIINIENSVSLFNSGVKPINSSNSKKLKIVIFYLGVKSSFWEPLRQGALYAKKELSKLNTDIELIPIIPSFNNIELTKQNYINQIKQAIEEKVDGICLPPLWPDLSKILNEAKNKNIPIFFYNTDLEDKNLRKLVYKEHSFNAGHILGELLAKNLNEKGNILVIRGIDDSFDMNSRIEGFNSSLKKYKKIKVIDNIFLKNTEKEAIDTFINYYKNNKLKIDGILCNSIYKFSIMRAIKELDRSKKEFVVFDQGTEVCQYIKNNLITISIGQDSFSQGRDILIHMYNYLNNEPIKESVIWSKSTIFNSDNVNKILS